MAIREVIKRVLEPERLQAIYNDGTLEAMDEISNWINHQDGLKLVPNSKGYNVIYGKSGTLDLLDNMWVVRLEPGDYNQYDERQFLELFKSI